MQYQLIILHEEVFLKGDNPNFNFSLTIGRLFSFFFHFIHKIIRLPLDKLRDIYTRRMEAVLPELSRDPTWVLNDFKLLI